MNKISIVIPCYNYGKYLQDCIDSILNINDERIEIIIVNDGSNDPFTIKKLNELCNQGFKIINQENKGLGNARNTGIKEAKGEYILPLDADNRIRAAHVKESIEILEKEPDVDIVYGDMQFFGEKSDLGRNKSINILEIIIYNHIDACAVYRKSVWTKIGGYREEIPVMGYEDWHFWLEAIFHGMRFKYVNEIFFEYRWHADSMLQAKKLIWDKIKIREYFYRYQYQLLEALFQCQKISKKEMRKDKAEINHILAYYHLSGGEIRKGYRYYLVSIFYFFSFKNFKIGFTSIFKRLL